MTTPHPFAMTALAALAALMVSSVQAQTAQAPVPVPAPALALAPAPVPFPALGEFRPVAPFQGNTATIFSGFEAGGVPAGSTYQPSAMRLMDGALFVTPTLTVALGHNDNVGLEPNATKQGSAFLSVSPKIIGTSAYRASRYSFGYTADIVRYGASSADNIENQELAATGLHGLDSRTTINWRAAYLDQFDPVGSTDRSVASNQPDHWTGLSAAVAGRYGAEGAKGQIEAELGYFDKQYQNNRAFTQAADYNSVSGSVRFYNRLAPRTRAVAEYRVNQLDYKLNSTNLDNLDQRVLVGAEWQATAATSGSVKVGYMNKKYKRVRPTYSGFTWEAAVRWQPLTYSQVDFSTGKAATDPSGDASNFVVATVYNASWTHNWNSYTRTKVGYSHNGGAYDGTGRRDKTDSFSLGVSYDMRRNVRLGAEYAYSKRNSNVGIYDYKRNLVTFLADLAF